MYQSKIIVLNKPPQMPNEQKHVLETKLKVLMVIPSYFPLVGGAEKQVAGLVNALGKMSCKSTIVTRLLPNTLKAEEVDGISIVRLKKTKYKYGFLLRLFYFILKNRNFFDVIHVHTLNSPAFISALSGRLIHTPVIVKVTRSGMGSQLSQLHSTKIGRLFFYSLSKLVTRFIAITDDVEKELLSLKVEKNKIVKIPNGVKLPIFKNFKKNPETACVFVYVGRLIARKRVDWLIRAFSKSNLSSNNRLVIIGNGNEMDNLKKLSRYLRQDSFVDFMGELKHEEVLKLLLHSDAFVLPSNSEGMSNSLLEAMANKLTVIASDIPANKSLIRNNFNGLLFSTINELSMCLVKVSTSSSLRIKLSQNANNDIKKNFSFELISKHYKNIYDGLL